ncbi:MAG TPA: hypothetical protein VJ731_11755 [Terriglobales bacterium]|nr:hypothetical protein [Terriglobales bacterium]
MNLLPVLCASIGGQIEAAVPCPFSENNRASDSRNQQEAADGDHLAQLPAAPWTRFAPE